MVEICGKKVKNQKDITAEMMMEYISKNYPQDKKWFKEVSFAEMPNVIFENETDKDGNIVYTSYVNKNGKTITRIKKKAIRTGKSMKFNLAKARAEFCKRYFPELSRKESITDMLNNW